jgi:hypothetical protein
MSEQTRRENSQSIFCPLALFDADDHAIRVDVAGPELDDLTDAQARRIGDLKQRPMF